MAPVIDGVFNAFGVPYVRAGVFLPGLTPPDDALITTVPLLVDTGASSTVLHPEDALYFGIDLSQLDYTASSTGIGGHSLSAQADGNVILRGDRFNFECPVSMRIAQPTEHNKRFPSLLGRDVLRQFNMRYEPANGILQFISNESTRVVSA